jgi:NADPH:quinone reductase
MAKTLSHSMGGRGLRGQVGLPKAQRFHLQKTGSPQSEVEQAFEQPRNACRVVRTESSRSTEKELCMRAFAVKSFGEAAAMLDMPTPASGDGVLVRIAYAGVNPGDYKFLANLNAQSRYPFVVGYDFAGVVERAGSNNQGLVAGDRVFGTAPRHGSYAEFTVVGDDKKPGHIARTPEGVADDQAAALPIPAVTALGSLDLLGLVEGEHVVVLGAAGGVGGYAVQMARARGANVIATVRGDADEARKLGAEEVFDAGSSDVIEQIRARYPEGVEAVLDLVTGEDAIKRDADIIKRGGRLVSTTHAADEEWFKQRQIVARNIGAESNPDYSAEGLATVGRMLAEGTITARVRLTANLADAADVLDKVRRGGIRGKAVIRI